MPKNKGDQMDLIIDFEELEGSALTRQDQCAKKNIKKEVVKDNNTTGRTFAYVRVSDSTKQDSSTQRHAIQEYANDKKLTVSQWQEFNLSGSKTTAKDRGIDDLLANLKPNDIVLVSDIARLGRDSVHQVLNTITSITTKGASVHFCYSKTVISPKDSNDIAGIFMAIGEAYAAVKFSEERSQKAKAACERRAKEGLHNGRKTGAVIKSKLDDHAAYIIDLISNGTAKTKIIEMLLNEKGVKIGKTRFYAWLSDRKIQY